VHNSNSRVSFSPEAVIGSRHEFAAPFRLEYLFLCCGVVGLFFAAFAKDNWLRYLRYRDGTRPSPLMARIILIVSGVAVILITYYVRSKGY